MTPQEILALPMGDNDAEVGTIKEYLKALLHQLWHKGESFSGKRPFGNSGWETELHAALVAGGAVPGSFDVDGYLEDADEDAATQVISEAISAL